MNTKPKLTFLIESNFSGYGCRVTGATEYHEFPVRVSVPAAPGRFQPKDRLEIRGQDGKAVPGTVRPLHLWADGSVRVWEVWMPASLKRGESRTFELVPTRSAAATKPASLSARSLGQPSAFTVTATLADGTTASQTVSFDAAPAARGLAVDENEQPLELCRADGAVLFKGALIRRRWSWYPAVELAVRVINYAPGEETAVQAVTLGFELPGRGPSRYTIRHAATAGGVPPRLYASDQPFDVRADGGGIHVTDIRQLGRQMTDYALYERGLYAQSVDTWVATADEQGGWLLVVPEAVERMPKGWSIRGRQVTIELHPAWARPLAWLRGMALYQRIQLTSIDRAASPEECENEALRWIRPPLVAVAAEVYRAAGWRIPFRYEPARFPRTELTIRDTWGFSWSYGTFNWGDMVGANKGSLPLLPGQSPDQGCARNHEYDFVACAAKEFARTGRPEIGKLCRSAAEHLMHTDFVAVSDDPWKEGGVPHHCNRHTTGAAYPSHMWIEGLALYYQLSGDPYALQVAKRVGDFYLQYVNERFWVVHATSREMGWTLVALGAIYDLTHESRYLQGIQKTVDFYLEAGVANFFPYDATFAMGVGMIGLDRVRPFHRNAEVRKFILGVLDYILAKRRDETGILDYNFDAERKGINYIETHLPEALRIGYELSGDLKYLRAAWRQFQIHQAGLPLTVQNRYQTDCGYAAGYHITWTMGCLASFAEQGWLDNQQFPEPARTRRAGSVRKRR